MNPTDLKETIREIIETVDRSGPLLRGRVTVIRYAIIDPILSTLGWSTWLPWECQPDHDLGTRSRVDYALFDGNGDIAVVIKVQSARTRIRYDRARLWESVRRMTHGVAVISDGFHWEVYDLSRRARNIDDKLVARLVLDAANPDGLDRMVEALCRWMDRDLWM